MSNLQILSQSIRTLDNLYSLTDLHVVSGNSEKHRPNQFTRLDTTQALVAEMQNEDPTSQPIKTLRGSHGGTYACKELVIAYAAWISPAFHLTVLRAFLNQVEQPKQLALPEPEPKIQISLTRQEWQKLINVWFLFTRFTDSLHPLFNKLRGLVADHLFNSPEFNLTRCDTALKETYGTISKIIEQVKP